MTEVVERRGSPRYEVVAHANVGSGAEAYVLPVLNISVTGAFVEGSPDQYAQLAMGATLELVLSASFPGSQKDEAVNIRCTGRIVRIEFAQPPRVGGFGLMITPASADDRKRMGSLMSHLAHLPPPRPSTLRF